MPSKRMPYDAALAAIVIRKVSKGIPLARICEVKSMPSRWDISFWRDTVPEFDDQMRQARAHGFDEISEATLHIADTPEIQEEVDIEYVKGRVVSKRVRRRDNTAHRRLKVDTRLKLLAVWDQRRYGTVRQEVGGEIDVRITGGLPDDD